eukprot:9957820-Karenia_brevis.AAC.1
MQSPQVLRTPDRQANLKGWTPKEEDDRIAFKRKVVDQLALNLCNGRSVEQSIQDNQEVCLEGINNVLQHSAFSINYCTQSTIRHDLNRKPVELRQAEQRSRQAATIEERRKCRRVEQRLR